MGQAASLRLAEAGAVTVVGDIAADKAKETADLITKRTQGAQTLALRSTSPTRPRCGARRGGGGAFRGIDIWVTRPG